LTARTKRTAASPRLAIPMRAVGLRVGRDIAGDLLERTLSLSVPAERGQGSLKDRVTQEVGGDADGEGYPRRGKRGTVPMPDRDGWAADEGRQGRKEGKG
jgi:hypothetical protein